MSDVHLDIRGAIAEIRLDNPSKLNALSMKMINALDAHADLVEVDKSIRVVLLTAAGDRAFCVGADIKEWAALKIINFRLSHGFVGNPPDLDWETSGFPMPYGIDVSPVDGSVWVARLYADDIARIDPETKEFEMIETPFNGPRRLRIDARGNGRPAATCGYEWVFTAAWPRRGMTTTWPSPLIKRPGSCRPPTAGRFWPLPTCCVESIASTTQ